MDQQPGVNSERLKGKVVLGDFWTRGSVSTVSIPCLTCATGRTKPRAAGLVVIGVHTPEYPWERSLPLLRHLVVAVKDWGWDISTLAGSPVVADNAESKVRHLERLFGNQCPACIVTFSTLADSRHRIEARGAGCPLPVTAYAPPIRRRGASLTPRLKGERGQDAGGRSLQPLS